jgi:hypothetical protein
MPFLMPNAWKRNKLVVHTVPYDLTILEGRPVLNERSSSISVPTLVIDAEKSPKRTPRCGHSRGERPSK